MSQRIRRHLSFANVVALMALVFAMGGTGYALSIPNNSVGTKQIKKNGVTNSDIRANAVTSSKVKDGSLKAVDFAAGQIPPGPAGVAGPAGVVGEITVVRTDVALPGGGAATGALATCPAGTKIIGGGTTLLESSALDINTTVSRPFLTGAPGNGLPITGQGFDSWRAVFVNGSVPPATGRVFAICAAT